MDVHYGIYGILALFAVAVSASLSVYAAGRVRFHRSPFLLVTLILVTLWIVAQMLEISAQTLPVKLALANIQYLSIMYAPVTFLFLAAQYTSQDRRLSKPWALVLLIGIPAVLQVLLWTNGSHELLRRNISLNMTGPFPVVSKEFGPLFWVFAVYNFVVTFLSIGLLGRALLDQTSVYRRQLACLLIGFCLPVFATALNLSGFSPFRVDPTPITFGFSGLIIVWGAFRHGLFDLVPVARSIIVEEMRTGVLVIDMDDRLLDINSSAAALLHIDANACIGLPTEIVLSSQPQLLDLCKHHVPATVELSTGSDARSVSYEVTLSPLHDNRNLPLGQLALIYDITERKRSEELMRTIALHDNLTGLANRQLLEELFAQQSDQALRSNEMAALAFLDLDNFKTVNDTYGHSVGDRLLQALAQRLRHAVRKSDTVARLGGDEFALLFPGLHEERLVHVLAEKLMRVIDETVAINEHQILISASIGFAIFPRDGDSIDALLQKADSLMYTAKRAGKHRYRVNPSS